MRREDWYYLRLGLFYLVSPLCFSLLAYFIKLDLLPVIYLYMAIIRILSLANATRLAREKGYSIFLFGVLSLITPGMSLIIASALNKKYVEVKDRV